MMLPDLCIQLLEVSSKSFAIDQMRAKRLIEKGSHTFRHKDLCVIFCSDIDFHVIDRIYLFNMNAFTPESEFFAHPRSTVYGQFLLQKAFGLLV